MNKFEEYLTDQEIVFKNITEDTEDHDHITYDFPVEGFWMTFYEDVINVYTEADGFIGDIVLEPGEDSQEAAIQYFLD